MKDQKKTDEAMEMHERFEQMIDKTAATDHAITDKANNVSVIKNRSELNKCKIDMMKQVDEDHNANIDKSLRDIEKFIFIK